VQTGATSDLNGADSSQLQPLGGGERHQFDGEGSEAKASGGLSPLQGLAGNTKAPKTSVKTAFSSALERALAGQAPPHVSKSANVQEKVERDVKPKEDQENELHGKAKDVPSENKTNSSSLADGSLDEVAQKQPEGLNQIKTLDQKPTDHKDLGQSLCESELPKKVEDALVKRPASATTHGPTWTGKKEDNKPAAHAVRPASARTYLPASDEMDGTPENEETAALTAEQRRLARERGRQVRITRTCAPMFEGVK
jgi:hypothetical protein